jgi:methionine sulfoxide reductase heme-binding subunit
MDIRTKSDNFTPVWISIPIFDAMSIKNLDNKTLARIKIVVFLLSLIPLSRLAYGAYLETLGANPIEKITRITGYWALTFLLISLTITPLRRILGWLWLIRMRRMLSLFAFFYACLHFLTYLVLDQFFDWDSIAEDIVKRPYITVGFPAFLLMIPMAITSTDKMIKRLGGKRWRLLHRLVFICAIGAVVHYWWLVKKDITNPVTFAAWLTVLLGIRLLYWLRNVRKQGLMESAEITS